MNVITMRLSSPVSESTNQFCPIEEKIAEIRNGINALRRAKTSRERNIFLDKQGLSLDALEVMLKGNRGNDPTVHRITRLERPV